MLSRKQMRRLIKSVYGANNKYSKELMRLYKRASRQIQGEISTFLSSKARVGQASHQKTIWTMLDGN